MGQGVRRDGGEPSKVVGQMRRRIVFFLRHHNDVDHVTPVIHFWSLVEGNDAFVVMLDEDVDLNDPRLTFLAAKKNVRVGTLVQLARSTNQWLGRPLRENRRVGEIVDFLARGSARIAFAFDYGTAPATVPLLAEARKLGIKCVALPHGDDPYMNYMITTNDLTYDGLTRSRRVGDFDLFVTASRITARRADEGWHDKHEVPGSARFADEWLPELEKILPPAVFPGSEGKLKLVFFLRNAKYPIFWEELGRLLALVLQFPGVYLVLAGHPRQYLDGTRTIDIPTPGAEDVSRHPSSSMTYVAADTYQGTQLIRWADAVLSLGTSVVYEAVLLGKPVFEIEYLHPNRTVVGTLFRNADIQCRDQIFQWIAKLSNDPAGTAAGFYRAEEMKRFREQCIDLGKPGTPERYVTLLQRLVDARDMSKAASRAADKSAD
jgi:hypothetical protein